MDLNNSDRINIAVVFVARQLKIGRLLGIVSWCLIAGFACGLSWLALSRMVFLPLTGAILALIVFSALVLGIIIGFSRPPVPHCLAAREIDRRYFQPELVLTSYEKTNSGQMSEVSMLAVDSAVNFLNRQDIRRDFRLKVSHNTPYLVSLAILCLAVTFFPGVKDRTAALINTQRQQSNILEEAAGNFTAEGQIHNDIKKLIDVMKSPTPAPPQQMLTAISDIDKTLASAERRAKIKEELEILLAQAAGEQSDTDNKDLLELIRERLQKSAPSEDQLNALREKLQQARMVFTGSGERKMLDDALEALTREELEKAYEKILALVANLKDVPDKMDMERLRLRLRSTKEALVDAYNSARMPLPPADIASPGEEPAGFSKFHAAPAPAAGPETSQQAFSVEKKYEDIVRRYCTH